MSLDGFIAGPRGETDWVTLDPAFDLVALFAEFDTLLVGRKTYETMLHEGRFDGAMDVIVFSRTLRQSDAVGALVRDDAVDTIDDLRKQTGKDLLLFGGSDLFASFVALGLVDAIEVMIVPIVLGSGTPLLPDTAQRAPLELARTRIYQATGAVWLDYRIARERTLDDSAKLHA